MALACELRIVANQACIGLPELTHGLVPGGGTERLPRLAGQAIAIEMLYTRRALTASEAVTCGLPNEAVSLDRLHSRVQALAMEIATHDPLALRYAKHLVNTASDVPEAGGAQLELDALFALMKRRTAGASSRA
jgi:enoyl-CoA hydratase/carnithine racemase